MKEPKLTLGLTECGERPVLLISRNDNEIFNQRVWPLAELTEAGYMGACHYIGFTVLRMLEYAHPQVLAPFPTLTPPPGPAIPVPDLITLLHRQSLDDRSSRYVATIDALMERHKDEVADTSWPEQWPTFRAHLLRTYSD